MGIHLPGISIEQHVFEHHELRSGDHHEHAHYGTGDMARGISTRLLAGGHVVKLYNPDREDAEQLASELRDTVATSGRVRRRQ